MLICAMGLVGCMSDVFGCFRQYGGWESQYETKTPKKLPVGLTEHIIGGEGGRIHCENKIPQNLLVSQIVIIFTEGSPTEDHGKTMDIMQSPCSSSGTNGLTILDHFSTRKMLHFLHF